MWVHREPEFPHNMAPSYDDCHRGVVEKDMQPFECCWEVLKSLTIIIKCLKTVRESQNAPSDGMLGDASGLLCLTP